MMQTPHEKVAGTPLSQPSMMLAALRQQRALLTLRRPPDRAAPLARFEGGPSAGSYLAAAMPALLRLARASLLLKPEAAHRCSHSLSPSLPSLPTGLSLAL